MEMLKEALMSRNIFAWVHCARVVRAVSEASKERGQRAGDFYLDCDSLLHSLEILPWRGRSAGRFR